MDFLKNLVGFEEGILPEETIILRLFLSVGLALVIGVVTFLTYRGKRYKLSFFFSQMILTIVGTMIIMVIGNNIARAFGLMGALNLIRFSARMEDPKDTALLFYSVGIGIALGSGLYQIAIYGVGIISLMLFIFWFVQSANPETSFLEFKYNNYELAKPSIEKAFEQAKIKLKLLKASNLESNYMAYTDIHRSAELGNRILKDHPDVISSFRSKTEE